MSGGLVVVTSHPDDEVLIAGGTLAACACAGIDTAVVCLTRGELGPISSPTLATRATLAAVRVNELEAACRELGVKWVRCYRRQDGNLRWANASAIVRQLLNLLEALRPDAVVSFGEDGLYYHPDHIATFDFASRAVTRMTRPALFYRSVWPQSLMPELVQELRARSLPEDLWDLSPEDFGVEDDETLTVDVRPFIDRKLCALQCHRTQLGPTHAFTALPSDLAQRFLGFERFARVETSADGGPHSEDGWLERAVSVGRVSA
ncbi:MAG: PIG-L deacetylase family protein [Solirubrobacteraceae bacterium]